MRKLRPTSRLRDVLRLPLPCNVPGVGYVVKAENASGGWVSIYGLAGAIHTHGGSYLQELTGSQHLFPSPDEARLRAAGELPGVAS